MIKISGFNINIKEQGQEQEQEQEQAQHPFLKRIHFS